MRKIAGDAAALDRAAYVAHEANRVYRETIGGPAVPIWKELTGEQRAGKRSGVKAALEGKTPEEMHIAWCEYKLKDGWRYGPRENEVSKEHPCLLPYDDLPIEQRRKDALFLGIVKALA